METIRETFKQHKIKATPQRLYVYSALLDSRAHLSVDEVYKHVKKKLPAISRATVYSILEHFRQYELVKELKIDFERVFYEACDKRHHHFFCRQCKAIYDVNITLCPTLQKKAVDGHTIDDFHGYFYGMCKHCKKK
ncbi:MAG: transcriptional repressor [Candidatus Omnitrophica bacterium]|nr:transcriptional repressor [Candidatus Omnitrophota bacterium]